MSKIEGSVQIKSPAEHVFSYATNPVNLPLWETNIVKVESPPEGGIKVGDRYSGVNSTMGQNMPWESEVTECEPNKSWAETITSGSTIIHERLTLEPLEDGTRLTLVYDMRTGGILKLLSPLIAGTMRRQTQRNLNRLKHILEAQS
jgi:uncharacterized membrane protein